MQRKSPERSTKSYLRHLSHCQGHVTENTEKTLTKTLRRPIKDGRIIEDCLGNEKLHLLC